MKYRNRALVVLALFAMAIPAQAVKLTRADVAKCSKEITEFHILALKSWRDYSKESCGWGSKTPAAKAECIKNADADFSQEKSKNAMEWFLKGNERCEGPEWPCFGISQFDSDTWKEFWESHIREWAAAPPLAHDSSGDFVNQCLSKVFLLKLGGVSASNAKGRGSPSTSSTGSASPSGGGMSAAPTAPVRKLSTKREPRSHVPGAMAQHCLKPQFGPGGGVVNDCPFAVEYSYCVEGPKKDSWSESFECGKSGGSWQVGAGPGKKSIMHTAGAKVHWFACRYGLSIAKPDGVSPKDVRYVPGQGMVGRCAEWGAK